jgi:hypothetical protein
VRKWVKGEWRPTANGMSYFKYIRDEHVIQVSSLGLGRANKDGERPVFPLMKGRDDGTREQTLVELSDQRFTTPYLKNSIQRAYDRGAENSLCKGGGAVISPVTPNRTHTGSDIPYYPVRFNSYSLGRDQADPRESKENQHRRRRPSYNRNYLESANARPFSARWLLEAL